jgi:DNA-binding CsgD family transcriptional regulator
LGWEEVVEVFPIAASFCGRCDTDLVPLVETVATPRFPAQVLRFARSIIGSNHLAAFALDDGGAPQIILTADGDPSCLSHSASDVFINRFWTRDPINCAQFSEIDLGGGVVIGTPANEFQRIPYRRYCYTRSGWSAVGANLIERLSLLRRRNDRTIRIDFYRSREAGGYGKDVLERIASSADLVLALMSRHSFGVLPPQKASSRKSYEDLIRRIAPQLTRREVEVCAGIALGLSSAAIGDTLGIGINTVLTYRKRAYARLNISSHHELLRAVFAAATMLGIEGRAENYAAGNAAETSKQIWPH